jgi:hypothetical protein
LSHQVRSKFNKHYEKIALECSIAATSPKKQPKVYDNFLVDLPDVFGEFTGSNIWRTDLVRTVKPSLD